MEENNNKDINIADKKTMADEEMSLSGSIYRSDKVFTSTNYIYLCMFLLIGLCFLVPFFYRLYDARRVSDRVSFTSEWTVSVINTNNTYEFYKVKHFSELDLKNKPRGTVVTFKAKIPENDSGTGYIVSLHCVRSAMEMFINDDKIYDYATSRYYEKQMIGSGRFTVDIPYSNKDKTLTIILYAGENNSFNKLFEPDIFLATSTYDPFVTENILVITFCSFMLIFGLILILISLVGMAFIRNFNQPLYIGLFSMMLGLYIGSRSLCLQLFSADVTFNTYIQYYTLFLLPLPLLFLCADIFREISPKIMDIVLGTIIALAICFSATMILIDFNFIHPHDLVFWYMIFFGILLVFNILLIVKDADHSHILMETGSLIFLICFTIDRIFMNLKTYDPVSNWINKYLLLLGGTIFIWFMTFNYFTLFYRAAYLNRRNRVIIRMAYRDTMTGLYNRSAIDHLIKKISVDGHFTLVCFDLNYLKKTNDLFGHKAGDDLIISFADVLKEAFDDKGYIFRMGGDEFMVLSGLETDSAGLKEALEKVDELMNKHNKSLSDAADEDLSEKAGYLLDAARGIASSSEAADQDSDILSIYDQTFKLADKRMYENKKQKKACRPDLSYVDDRI
ncbi:MAG: GGDEF domain-containing protein [Lachnospiraceae bacterium]|jgi:diguanylate cyclase (GGDEF)-like protein|nr:GGDEF domain-containing protein [Lachnospiraceae bacterium]MEE3461134.1 GGDEF domain-containing protein [Lachnospiraceae bacterium]